MEVSQSCFCCVVSSCFRAGEEEQQAQSKKALKKQQKEAEKAAKKAEKQAKLVSVCQETQTLPTVLPTAHHCRRGFHCSAIPVITNHACAFCGICASRKYFHNILNRQNEHCAYFVCLMSYFIRSEWNLGCEVCSILYWLFNYIYIFK